MQCHPDGAWHVFLCQAESKDLQLFLQLLLLFFLSSLAQPRICCSHVPLWTV